MRHKSIEGGTDTIAYGHKLTQEEHDGNYLLLDGEKLPLEIGITEEQAQRIFELDKQRFADRAEQQFNKHKPSGLEWSDLKEGHRQILTAIAFNVGTLETKKSGKWGWPSLVKAMKADDKEGIKREMLTVTGGKPLTRKRDLLFEAVEDML